MIAQVTLRRRLGMVSQESLNIELLKYQQMRGATAWTLAQAVMP
jgi:hypothetical protein